MTKQEIKLFLCSSFQVGRRKKRLISRIKHLEGYIFTKDILVFGEPDHENSTYESIHNIVLGVRNLQGAYQETVADMVEIETGIYNMLQSIEEPRYQEVLFLRYIEHKTWAEVANLMHYSEYHVKRLHNKGIDQILKQRKREVST